MVYKAGCWVGGGECYGVCGGGGGGATLFISCHSEREALSLKHTPIYSPISNSSIAKPKPGALGRLQAKGWNTKPVRG